MDSVPRDVTLPSLDTNDLIDAVEQVSNLPELHNLYFLVPLTLTATNTTSDYSNTAAGASAAGVAKGTGKQKGKGKGKAQGNRRLSATPDNKRICFKYNSGGCPGNCGYLHVCQLCFSNHSRKDCPKRRKADTQP